MPDSSVTAPSSDAATVLSDLHDAVDAVVAALAANDDWGPSSGRADARESDTLITVLYRKVRVSEWLPG